MRRLESDTVLDSVFAIDTNPVLPLPVIFQHLTLASVLLIRRALGGRYNNVGILSRSTIVQNSIRSRYSLRIVSISRSTNGWESGIYGTVCISMISSTRRLAGHWWKRYNGS